MTQVAKFAPLVAPSCTARTGWSKRLTACCKTTSTLGCVEKPQGPGGLRWYCRAARNWECYDQILESLKKLEADESLLIQSGKPVGVFKTHPDAPRVLLANSNLVPKWATWEKFNELDQKGLFMYGQMTAGSWIYIGAQGIVQGTFETFVEAGRQHYNNDLTGKWILTAGLGGMAAAQPLVGVLAGACVLAIECKQSSIDFPACAPAMWTSRPRTLMTHWLDQAPH